MNGSTSDPVLPPGSTLSGLLRRCLEWLCDEAWIDAIPSELDCIVRDLTADLFPHAQPPKAASGPAVCRYCDRRYSIGSTWYQQAVLGQMVWVCAPCAIEQPGCEPMTPQQEDDNEIPF